MTAKLGLLALLEAKPDKGDELGAFLEAGRALAVQEAGTLTWYAFKISDTTYGIFDSFETEDARQAHLGGEIPTALGQVAADLLAKDPTSAPWTSSPSSSRTARYPAVINPSRTLVHLIGDSHDLAPPGRPLPDPPRATPRW